jgi:peptidoglycan/LPS O-acetylase OafA/YrhL
VLSGYLITMLALHEEEARGRLDFAAFYIRRMFRIVPLYSVVLAAYVVLILGLKVSPEKVEGFVRALPYYLLYLQEIPYFRSYSSFSFYQSWSLGIEEKFYLIWPMIAFGALAFAKGLREIVTAVIILILVFSPALFTSIRWYGLENYGYILMGAVLAMVLEDRAGFAFLQGLGDVGLAVVLTVLIPLQFSALQQAPRSYARSVYALIVMLCLGILVTTEGKIQSVLSHPILGFIGDLSYGIYLVHILCLNVAEKAFPPGKGLAIPAYILACLISIAVAYILHRAVEKPMIHVGRMLSSRRLEKHSLGAV